jgi:hypothetical protein
MKELILITSHTPDNKREGLLRDFIKSIKDSEYDIMVVSHTPIPKDIMDGVDYFIFDKQNLLLYNVEDKVIMQFENPNFIIYSTETKRYNHCLSFIKLLKLGLSNAKNLNYKKVHFFEYDSMVNNFSEIKENSKLIDSVGTVFYNPLHLKWPNSPMSFNLDKISEEWFQLTYDDYIEFMSTKYSKVSEEYQMFLIEKQGEYISKSISELKEKGIQVGLHVDSDKTPWAVVVCDILKNEMVFFGWNTKQNQLDFKIIINNKEVITKKIDQNVWTLLNVGNFDEIKNIVIIADNEIKNVLDFQSVDKEKFKERNFLKIK